MNNPTISIVMPVKNTSLFLIECLDSIINQTINNWELIAIDDNSTDTSFEILTEYSKNDSRIKVLKNNKNGIIPALQLAYKNSVGEYITRMDSDDIMEPNKLELLQNSLLKQGKNYLAVGLVNYFSKNELGAGYKKYADWLNQLTMSENNFSDIYKECTIPSPCWMIAKEDFEKCGAFNSEVYPEDYDLTFRFKKQGLKIACVKQVIHNWRDYKTRTSRTDDNYADNRFSEIKIKHFLDQDCNSELTLFLWGAGNKGKQLAKLLTKNNIPFNWICNNPNKIGKHIYNIEMQNLQELETIEPTQVIVAVSSVNDADEIKELVAKKNQHIFYRFC